MKRRTLLALIFSTLSITAFSQSLNDSLKAHFKFDGSVLDATVYGEDLKSPVNPQYRLVKGADSAYYFDGSSRLESDTKFDNSSFTEVSLSLWFKSSSSNSQTILQGAYIGYGIFIEGPSGKVSAFFDGSSAGAIQSNSDFSDNEWHHIVAQNDGSTTSLYIDGRLIGKQIENLTTGNGGSNNKLYLGDNRLYSSPYTGYLNEVRIYNRILSSCEIDELADNPSLNNHLKAHYKFDGNLLDATPNSEDIRAATNLNYEVITGDDSALVFDGSTRLQLDSSFDNSSYKETALSCWFKTSNKDDQVLFSGAHLGFGISMYPSGKLYTVFDGNSTNPIVSKNDLADGKWHHVFSQNNGGTTTLYIDGIYESSISETLYTGNGGSNNIIYFGNSKTGPSINAHYFDGSLNDVRIYDQTLTHCQIDSLYQMSKPKDIAFCDSSGLVDSSSLNVNLKAYFTFNGTVADSSVNGEDLLLPSNPDYRVVKGSDSAYYFDGNSRLESENPYDNSTYAKASISLWFKTSSTASRQTILQGANMGFGVYFDGSLGEIKAFFDPPSSLALSSSMKNLNDDKWHHVVAQNNGDTTYLFIDGVFSGSKHNSLVPGNGSSNNKLYFGQTNMNVDPYTGLLNEVRIYNRILGECEIDSLFSANKPDTSVVTSIAKNLIASDFKDIAIYPNPTKGAIHLKNHGTQTTALISIKTISGQVVLERNDLLDQDLNLFIDGPAGMYFLELSDTQGNRSITKIIKQ